MEVTINYNDKLWPWRSHWKSMNFLTGPTTKPRTCPMSSGGIGMAGSLDEYIVATEGVGIYGETPEEYLCRMETLDELMAVLDTCTEAQRRRFLLYALDGLTLAEIGTVCGCSKVAVYQSVEAVRKKIYKIL